jgi:hypothetical protein
MVLTVSLVLVPSSPGLRPGPREAETPIAPITIHLGESCLRVFCQKPALYWQIEGFWRFLAESADSRPERLNPNPQHLEPNLQSVNPKVEPVEARVEPLSPNVEPADVRVELGNANLQSADATVQPANPEN